MGSIQHSSLADLLAPLESHPQSLAVSQKSEPQSIVEVAFPFGEEKRVVYPNPTFLNEFANNCSNSGVYRFRQECEINDLLLKKHTHNTKCTTQSIKARYQRIELIWTEGNDRKIDLD